MYRPVPKTTRWKRVRKYSQKPEGSLQTACEDYLNIKGLTYIRIPDYVYKAIFASNSSPWMKSLASYHLKGVADLTILGSDGRFVCVELKSATGRQTQGQKDWSRKILNHYHVVRDFSVFKTLIDSIWP